MEFVSGSEVVGVTGGAVVVIDGSQYVTVTGGGVTMSVMVTKSIIVVGGVDVTGRVALGGGVGVVVLNPASDEVGGRNTVEVSSTSMFEVTTAVTTITSVEVSVALVASSGTA